MTMSTNPALHARVVLFAALSVFCSITFAQPGPAARAATQTFVIDGGTVHTVSGPAIPNGRVRIEAERIVAVGGSEVSLAGAERIDATGKQVYPGLIAAHSVLGLTEIGAVRATVDVAEVGLNAANVRAEVAVNAESELIPVTRANGVLLALTAPQASASSVITGTSALIELDGWTWEDLTLQAPVGLHVVWPTGETPPWLPAEMAQAAKKAVAEKLRGLRRAFEQARTYGAAAEASAIATPDLRLAAMQPALQRQQPVFIHAEDAQAIGEALDFAAEFKLRAAWRLADRLRAMDVPVILGGTHVMPLRRFDPVDAIYAQAAKLKAAGVRFAIATPGDGFDTSNLRNLPYQAASAVAYGLSFEDALRAITLSPAEILGVADRVGSIEPGKLATLVIADGDPLEARTHVERAWISGREVDLSSRHTRLYEKYRGR
jgi:imidazolonepropionase-like amidohydrolase